MSLIEPSHHAVDVVSFGCRLNAFESELIHERARAAGLDDVAIVNTCAVTGEAVAQARQTIRRLRRERPDRRIVVTGCAAQTRPEMFAAMMEAIQEESVGFLFNLEVEVEPVPAEVTLDGVAPDGPVRAAGGPAGARGAGPDGAGPQSAAGGAGAELDAEAVLASIASGESEPPGTHPHITAKGLDRTGQNAPLTYSAPALGSDAPEVHTEGGQRPATSRTAKAANQRRANPNRGSRGNKRKR